MLNCVVPCVYVITSFFTIYHVYRFFWCQNLCIFNGKVVWTTTKKTIAFELQTTAFKSIIKCAMCSLCRKVCTVQCKENKKNVALHVFQALSIRSAFVEMAKYWFAHGRRANVPTFNPIFICIIDYFKLILSRNSHHLFHFNTLFKVNTVWEWIEWNITCISNKHLNLFWIRSEVILDRVWNKFWFSSRCSIQFHLSVFEFFTPFDGLLSLLHSESFIRR